MVGRLSFISGMFRVVKRVCAGLVLLHLRMPCVLYKPSTGLRGPFSSESGDPQPGPGALSHLQMPLGARGGPNDATPSTSSRSL